MKKEISEKTKQFLKSIAIILIGIGIVVYSFARNGGYYMSPVKAKAEATIVDVNMKEHISDDNSDAFKKYYYYVLTWQFEYGGSNHTFETTAKRQMQNAYKEGQKQVFRVYSKNDDEFKVLFNPAYELYLPFVGAAVSVIGVVDFIKKKKEEE